MMVQRWLYDFDYKDLQIEHAVGRYCTLSARFLGVYNFDGPYTAGMRGGDVIFVP